MLLVVATHRPLLFFQTVFLNSCKLEVSILQGTLIWTQTAVSWSYILRQVGSQIVELDVMIGHAIHVLIVLWVGRLLPSVLNSACFCVYQLDLSIPLPLDLVGNLSRSRIDRSIQTVVVIARPVPLVEGNFNILVIRACDIPNIGFPADI